MVGWKKLQAQEGKARWRDRLLVRTDWIGKLGTLVAPLANWANAQSWFRGILHRIVGIHRDRQLVRFQEETFPHWLQRTRDDRRRGLYVGRRAEVGAGGVRVPVAPSNATGDGPPPAAKVVLFSTCLVDYHSVEVGQATVAVLEKNEVEVVRPEQQCCGMPLFDTGDIPRILREAHANVAALQRCVARGDDLVAALTSCSLLVK